MKKLLLTCLFMALCATMVMAGNIKDTPGQKLREQIIEMLKVPNIEFNGNEVQAKIHFTLNKKGEIVILSIDSENLSLDNYIKTKLNYRRVLIHGIAAGEKFIMNVRLMK